jgi:hypothetical protein
LAVTAAGGGSGAVGASTHAACARFRGTDPLVTGFTRRSLAERLKFPDVAGGIPEARWMRAMTFERLVRDERFASQVATTTVGRLALERPTEVVIANARGNVDRTATLLAEAHDRAVSDGAATVVHNLAVPFVGYEATRATDVKPDFAVVAPKTKPEGGGSWLIVGDAKDYERLRSRIEDTRLLKGFLQVAVGAESFAAWSQVPSGMEVHRWGALAVPRNAFLQPEAVVEDLTDHRAEIAMRIAERQAEAQLHLYDPNTPVNDFVAHLKATFDPVSCTTCTLFGYCRDELERSADPTDLLIELGIPRDTRPHVIGLVDGTGVVGKPPASVVATVTATLSGTSASTGQKRIDPVGDPGTINVVIAKSDAAALGLHGIAFRRVSATGTSDWTYVRFDEPQSPATRQSVMKLLGKEISAAMAEARRENKGSPAPVHLVVPDKSTADVLVSIADNLAGVELSRLRWQRDKDQGRPPLTYDGEPAVVPRKLPEADRTAVSFLLEEDRARAVTLRSPIVDIRAVLARHVVAGGPAVNSGRLDYLVEWADPAATVDHRSFGKTIETSRHTPGARLANQTSDEFHRALTGDRATGGAPDLPLYAQLVRQELEYKTAVFDRAVAAVAALPISNLREAYRSLEAGAQAVWRRRLSLHASDLVRFGRIYRWWRNSQVPTIESDVTCAAQLLALTNPQAAHDLATAAGTREVAFATVVEMKPSVVLKVDSRRIGDGSRVVLLHVNDTACVEAPAVTVDASPKGAFKIDGLGIGPLQPFRPGDDTYRFHLVWQPDTTPSLAVGDRLVLADFAWFSTTQSGNRYLPVHKPPPDERSAPKDDCTSSSYDDDPADHGFCCRSHEHAEAEFSDELAARRARGELNPQVWPPVRNADSFEVAAEGSREGDPFDEPSEPAPDVLTIDDLE